MRTYIVDSFTTEAFKGNPAGVCFPAGDISDERMLNVARELGLSETAFVWAIADTGTHRIRYFSPKKEIPLCGHATLASAKVLFKNNGGRQIHFITGENLDLFITREDEEIIMEFPTYDTVEIEVPSEVLSAMGLNKVVNTAYSEKSKIIVLEIHDADLLAKLTPDFTALINSYNGINGVLVTAASNNNEYDYHYRYFWPWAGTNEDPVTGGVQTFLAKYWSKKLGKTRMKAFQSSARTGFMYLELKNNKVFLRSQAVIVLEGNLVSIY